jgi:ERCC4-type nuclease
MNRHEVDSILDSFRVIVDNREHKTPKERKRYKAIGTTERATLSFGDYCGNVDIDGSPLCDTSATISPLCVIERKMNLDELAMCFTRSRKRFEREFERARAAGAKVYLLVEDATYEDIIRHRYRSKFASNAFLASLLTWSARYNLTPVFCRAETSGELIREILLRDLRERLERGEYG